MISSIIIVIISFVLDVILNNFLPYMVNDLSLFTPLCVLVSLVCIYPFFTKNIKKYIILSTVVGFIYDFLFTNLLFYHALLFIGISFIIYILYRYIEVNFLTIIFYILLVITIYEVMNCLVILAFNLVPITFFDLLYKIGHSLIMNIIYGEILYFVVKYISKKSKKLSIN